VKRPRSLKQFTLTTARAPIVVSETAAMKTPQRRQMRKSQVRLPKRNSLRATSHPPKPRINLVYQKQSADYAAADSLKMLKREIRPQPVEGGAHQADALRRQDGVVRHHGRHGGLELAIQRQRDGEVQIAENLTPVVRKRLAAL
jgi:hypothetical protein